MGGAGTTIAGPSLIADIGGTHARFALAEGGRVTAMEVLRAADFGNIEAAIRSYLDRAAPDPAPSAAAFAVASPMTGGGDRIDLTNSDWSFSIAALRRGLGLDTLHVVNDFAAVALSVPRLGSGEVEKIGGGNAVDGAPVAIIGPGTGLGVSGLVRPEGRAMPIATEGGHVTLAAADAREDAVIAHLRDRFGHVSAERALSGPGLVNLYAAISGASGDALTPAEVTERALAGSDPACVDALHMFCAMLGTVAGNLALSLGALGGVYIAGGIVPRLGSFFAESAFRARFEAKGRFTGYNAAIPTFVITAETPAFIGLAALLDEAG